MNWFTVLKDSQRAASGLEWQIWRKLPLIALLGSLLPALLWLGLDLWLDAASNARDARFLSTAGYVAVGAAVFHLTMVLTVGIGCAVVMVMKGPGYVADAYPVPHRDRPSGTDSEASDGSV